MCRTDVQTILSVRLYASGAGVNDAYVAYDLIYLALWEKNGIIPSQCQRAELHTPL